MKTKSSHPKSTVLFNCLFFFCFTCIAQDDICTYSDARHITPKKVANKLIRDFNTIYSNHSLAKGGWTDIKIDSIAKDKLLEGEQCGLLFAFIYHDSKFKVAYQYVTNITNEESPVNRFIPGTNYPVSLCPGRFVAGNVSSETLLNDKMTTMYNQCYFDTIPTLDGDVIRTAAGTFEGLFNTAGQPEICTEPAGFIHRAEINYLLTGTTDNRLRIFWAYEENPIPGEETPSNKIRIVVVGIKKVTYGEDVRYENIWNDRAVILEQSWPPFSAIQMNKKKPNTKPEVWK